MSISSIVLHNLVGVGSEGPGETSEVGLRFRNLTRLWIPAMLTLRPLILRDLRIGQLAPTRARVSSLTMSDRSRCYKIVSRILSLSTEETANSSNPAIHFL